MMRKKCCGKRCVKRENKIFGIILLSLGAGFFIAYIIPRYFLITVLGAALCFLGISCLIKK